MNLQVILSFCFILTIYYTHSQNVDSSKYNSKDSLEVCSLTDDVSNSMNLIKRDVKTFRYANSINDNCYLALIDSLAERFIRTSDVQYMECLELISSIRDGYVAEYFPEIGKRLYYGSFNGYFNFIYRKKDNKFNPMKDVFIEAVAEEIYYDKNEVNLSKYFKSQIKKNELDKEKKKYLSNLIEMAKEYIEKLR